MGVTVEAGNAGGEEDVVIRISVDAGIDAIDSASVATLLEDVLTIKTVGSPGKVFPWPTPLVIEKLKEISPL